MKSKICLVLHRKSANEPAVKEAVKYVRGQGIKLRVRIPWNKKDKPRVVQEARDAGAKRIIAESPVAWLHNKGLPRTQPVLDLLSQRPR